MSVLLTTDLPNLFSRGKVRDTYDLGDRLLVVATDRMSAFDVVMRQGVPDKGAVLTLLSAFWFERTAAILPSHYIAVVRDTGWPYSDALTGYLDTVPENLVNRAMIVHKADRIDVECVARGYLAGTGWEQYQQDGTVCGVPLPAGLRESDRLPEPIFAPTTKAEAGHDLPMTYQQVVDQVGGETAAALRDATLALYRHAAAVAADRGILIADTKFEFGRIHGELALIDEALTPDSSRFWPADRYTPGHGQPSFDKQPLRDWLAASGWNKEPPPPDLPVEVVAATANRYREAYRRITGEEISGMWVAKIVVSLKPVVNDPPGLAIHGGLMTLGFSGVRKVRSGKYFEITLDARDEAEARDAADRMCRTLLANPVIEDYRFEVSQSA